MPLMIVTALFVLLFSIEGLWHIACRCREEDALRRYHSYEHPRRRTSDRYLDLLG